MYRLSVTAVTAVFVWSVASWAAPDNLKKGTPTPTDGAVTITQILDRRGFALGYCEEHEQAAWVAYKFTRNEATQKVVKRLSEYRADPEIITGSATNRDYLNSGYSRGHQATANHMRWNAEVQRQCAYYSNMTPQKQAFNNGTWKKLEEQVEKWAKEHRTIWVVTGPVLTGELAKLPNSSVSIPEQFYKVMLYTWGNNATAVGFLIPHSATSEPFERFAVSVDSVEAVTHLDFFGKLPDALENEAERTYDEDFWFEQ